MAKQGVESFKSMEAKLADLQESVANINVNVKELRRDHLQDIDDLAQRVTNCEINEADLEEQFREKLKKVLLEARTRAK